MSTALTHSDDDPDDLGLRLVPRSPPAPARTDASPINDPLVLADPLLSLAADVVDDLEKVRIANENRLRQLTRIDDDSDGELRGFGYTLDHPDVARLAGIVDALAAAERAAILNLQRTMRRHPMGPWAKGLRGVGDTQLARLLASIGDPYIRPELFYDDGTSELSRPRTVSELWALCGYRPGQRRTKGQRANWSSDAKMRAYLVAAKCVQVGLVAPCATTKDAKGAYIRTEHVDGCACSPYRVTYDRGRDKYSGTAHPEDCVRCGPAGKPALAGSVRSAKHIHQSAIRLATKALLRDLWREARRLHELHDGQDRRATQKAAAVGDLLPHHHTGDAT